MNTIEALEHDVLAGFLSRQVCRYHHVGGKLMAFVLSAGERHESRYIEALLTCGRVRRAGRGRPRVRPVQLAGDRGYSYPHLRRALARRHIRAVIPRRRDPQPGDRRHRPLGCMRYH